MSKIKQESNVIKPQQQALAWYRAGYRDGLNSVQLMITAARKAPARKKAKKR